MIVRSPFVALAIGLVASMLPTVESSATEPLRGAGLGLGIVGTFRCDEIDPASPGPRPFVITFDLARTTTTSSVVAALGNLRGQGAWRPSGDATVDVRELVVAGGIAASLTSRFTIESAESLSFSMAVSDPVSPVQSGRCTRVRVE